MSTSRTILVEVAMLILSIMAILLKQEFKAMAQSPDPANEDFLKDGKTTGRSRESIIIQRKKEQSDEKREAFSRCVRTCKMESDDIYAMWKVVRQRKDISRADFLIGYKGVCELMPANFYSAAECRVIHDLLRNGQEMLDSRDLILTFTNFVPGLVLEEKCKLAFEMFDVDRSGYLSIDEIEAMMMSTNLTTRDLVKKRAANFLLCADIDRYVYQDFQFDALFSFAEKFSSRSCGFQLLLLLISEHVMYLT